MGLLGKVRVLVGALVRKPFTPRPEKVLLEERRESSREGNEPQESVSRQAPDTRVEDSDRVADLIAQQRQDEAN